MTGEAVPATVWHWTRDENLLYKVRHCILFSIKFQNREVHVKGCYTFNKIFALLSFRIISSAIRAQLICLHWSQTNGWHESKMADKSDENVFMKAFSSLLPSCRSCRSPTWQFFCLLITLSVTWWSPVGHPVGHLLGKFFLFPLIPIPQI